LVATYVKKTVTGTKGVEPDKSLTKSANIPEVQMTEMRESVVAKRKQREGGEALQEMRGRFNTSAGISGKGTRSGWGGVREHYARMKKGGRGGGGKRTKEG